MPDHRITLHHIEDTAMNFFRTINNTVAGIVDKPGMATTLALLTRLLLAAIFVIAGIGKIADPAGTAGYMQAMGVPTFLLPLVIALELGGGIALIVGFQTRLAGLALAVFSIVSAFIFHHGSDQISQIMFLKNFAMAGGLLSLTLNGAGRASLDAEKTA
jgi:putative oxidoreductase